MERARSAVLCPTLTRHHGRSMFIRKPFSTVLLALSLVACGGGGGGGGDADVSISSHSPDLLQAQAFEGEGMAPRCE